MERDGRVIMIVRATSPRQPPQGDPEALTLGAMEADWRQQQFQRQRMQLLSMAIFLCFMVLFFDNRAGDHRASQLGKRTTDANGNTRYAWQHEPVNDTERLAKLGRLEDVLRQQPRYLPTTPSMNVSGIYSGTGPTLAVATGRRIPVTDYCIYLYGAQACGSR